MTWNQGQASAPSDTYSMVDAGYVHTCGIDPSSGAVSCWGSEDTLDTRGVPGGTFEKVYSGMYNACAPDASGRLTCWITGASSARAGVRATVGGAPEHFRKCMPCDFSNDCAPSRR